MSYFASIQILHLPSGCELETIKEATPSLEEARKQFSKLAETIALLDKDNDSIVLETTEGYIALFRKVLSESIIRLKTNQDE